jgi:hypothetical protein
MEHEVHYMAPSQRPPDGVNEAGEPRLRKVTEEIARRVKAVSDEHRRLDLEVQVHKTGLGGLQPSGADQAALESYVESKKKADLRIQAEYSDPSHPYWEYKCAEYGNASFNRRVLCPAPFLGIFAESYSGCFCTKNKTYMLEGWNSPDELAAQAAQARRIGHPFELVFVPEGREAAVEALKSKGLIKNPRIIMWLNPHNPDPPPETRKETYRNAWGINALDSNDLGALYYPPTKTPTGVDLRGSLTGLDTWTDMILADNLVKIGYEEEKYRPPYRITAKNKPQ